MEDLGFYMGVYEEAEPMAWGMGAGCTLLQNKCLINGVELVSSVDPNTRDMFCTTPNVSSPQCTSSRLSMGYCDVVNASVPYPFYAQYFISRYIGGTDASMDFCPFIQHNTGDDLSCDNSSGVEWKPKMGGSVFSPGAR
ncbi:leishmanolysin-like, partial [Bactrocera neohumeralis]|uniref:leishmanolysin-like n=1 Tax=Bactrocera neohumeralis TaxID=98809 RepID=UPI002166A541